MCGLQSKSFNMRFEEIVLTKCGLRGPVVFVSRFHCINNLFNSIRLMTNCHNLTDLVDLFILNLHFQISLEELIFGPGIHNGHKHFLYKACCHYKLSYTRHVWQHSGKSGAYILVSGAKVLDPPVSKILLSNLKLIMSFQPL